MYKNNKLRFDRLFRGCRHVLGITQKEMAEKLHVLQGHISQLENRTASPSAEILMRLLIVTSEIEFPGLFNNPKSIVEE